MPYLPIYMTYQSYLQQQSFYGACLSALAYEREEEWETYLVEATAALEARKLPTENELVPHALYVRHPAGYSIAVEGTVNSTQWLSYPVQAGMTTFEGIPGELFAPFAESGRSIYLALRPRIDRKYPLFLTGHSLGGAAAHVVAALFRRDGYRIAGVYTFGAPKVGTKPLHAWYDVPAFHVANEGDVVPFMPPDLCATVSVDFQVGPRVPVCYNLGRRIDVGDLVAQIGPAELLQRYHEGIQGIGRGIGSTHVIATYLRELWTTMEKASRNQLLDLAQVVTLLGYLQ
jgi:pimeloyl-ACP methyl ester carboxylesterase